MKVMNYSIFDDLDEYVYIADAESYELIYANKKVLKNFGHDVRTNVKGMKCYKFLHRSDTPCSFCNNCKLKVDAVETWSIDNALLNKTFELRDGLILDGDRKLRIEIAKEKNELATSKHAKEIQEYFIDRAFGIASKETDIDHSIEVFLETIGKFIQSDRAYIFEDFESYSSNTYEWCAEGVSQEKQNLQRVEKSALQSWYDAFDSEGEVYIEDLEHIKDQHPDMYAYLKPQNIGNLMVRPIILNGQRIGFYGVDNMNLTMVHDIRSVLGMLSSFMAILFEKRNYIRYIQYNGTYDYLTNIYNRKTASNIINRLLKDVGGALVLIDLDNFKSVNDKLGHAKGDEVLKQTARKMKEVARENDLVFRLGGDEFGIFFPSLTDFDIISTKCEMLIDKLNMDVHEGEDKVHVSASIGVYVAKNMESAFVEIYPKADEMLYKAKKAGKNQFFISM